MTRRPRRHLPGGHLSGSQPPPPPLPQPFPGPGLPSVAVTGADTGDRIHYHKTKANRGGGHCALSLRYAFIVPCVCPPILKLQNEFDLSKLTASQYQTHDVFTVRAGGARQGAGYNSKIISIRHMYSKKHPQPPMQSSAEGAAMYHGTKVNAVRQSAELQPSWDSQQ